VEQYLITLLVKTGFAAALASFGVRSAAVKRMLQREERTLGQRLRLAAWFSAMFLPGVVTRVVTGSYFALDLGLEGSLLAGITGGYVCGWVSGMAMAVPAMLHGELLALPFFSVVGLGGGLLRDSAFDREEIWRFSPFPDLNLYRIFQRGRELSSALLHAYFAVGVLAVEFLRQALGTAYTNPTRLFTLGRLGDPPALLAGLYVSTYFCITLPLKVWANTRNETMFEEQQNLLLQARLQALSSQINPHFLFNTLNSISSLIRLDPEQARTMVTRLARIMRQRLRSPDHFTPLGSEIEFLDDYLSIELVRFGSKLRVVKRIDPAAADVLMPSMLLQPLVENCIKHGISGKVEGGTITLSARRLGSRLIMEVEDDGSGISETDLPLVFSKGIGVSNVKERLQVLYGRDYRFEIDSREGFGTRIEIEIPEMQNPPVGAASSTTSPDIANRS
jgi:two-component system LytT family sensor kinase